MSHPNSYPTTVKPSATEIERQCLTPQNLETAIRCLHEDGLVVIANIVPHREIDNLNTFMVKDARTLQNRNDDSPYNYNKGNIQLDPPPVKEAFSTNVFLHPIVTQVTSTHLGPRPKWTFCSSNVALPPTTETPPQSQPVHSDADFAHPRHPFALVVNVPLIDMTPHNGSTEIWLGTHNDSGVHQQVGRHGERASGKIRSELLEQRRSERPPCQPLVEKGSIIIRDLRLWHAGRGNFSDDVRVMVAMIHFAPWYRNQMRLEFSEDLKPLVEAHTELEIPIDWSSRDDILNAYLNRGFGNSYDFDQTA